MSILRHGLHGFSSASLPDHKINRIERTHALELAARKSLKPRLNRTDTLMAGRMLREVEVTAAMPQVRPWAASSPVSER
jgi:hypothetical protein